jgi:tetratricopeptide (TPR) repeat protein
VSLLLEALKKAEKAKEEAQKRAREGEPEPAGELRLADEPPAAGEEKRVVTRDELPPITAPLEIQSEDIGAAASTRGAGGLPPQGAARPAAGAARAKADPQGAQRAAARKPFEAKVREPNPRMPFYITVGVLGTACVATVVYFWIQLRPPTSLYIANAKPQPAAETPAAQPAPQVRSAPDAGSGAIPGLPGVAPQAIEAKPAAPPPPPKMAAAPRTPSEGESRAAPRREPPVEPRATVRARPRPAESAAQSAPAPQSIRTTVTQSRPQPRIHPSVSSGYAAYQAGDMERARLDYESALRDEPANRDALLGLAAVETRARRFGAAEALYRQLLQADPRDPHAQAGLLGLRAAQIDPVSAESRLKGLIAGDTAESVLYFSLGNQYAQQARWAEAQQAYARAAALDGDNPDFAYNHAVSLEHSKQPQAALQEYRRALVLGLKRTASFDPAAAQSRVQALAR